MAWRWTKLGGPFLRLAQHIEIRREGGRMTERKSAWILAKWTIIAIRFMSEANRNSYPEATATMSLS